MRTIYGDRQTGKTTTLIELCYEAEQRGEISYIVCHNHDEAYRVAQVAKEMGKPIPFPITYGEFVNHRYYGSHIKQLFFDNADIFIRWCSTVPIAAITMSKHEDG